MEHAEEGYASSADMSNNLEEILNEDMEDAEVCEAAMAILGLTMDDGVCSSPVQQYLDDAQLSQPPGAVKQDRSINTYEYPGNLFEFTCEHPCPEKGVTAAGLWRNLGQKREDQMYMTHIRMPKRAFENLLERLRRQGPGGEQDTAFLGRKDGTQACVPGQRSYSFRRILVLTLYFLAHASTVSQLSSTFSVPPSTAWTLVGEGVTALVRVLLHGVGGNTRVVSFPQSDEEKLAVIGGFEELIGHMPWVIGAIDGTHIGQRKPDVTRCPLGRDLYWSWKSKNSQLLVWIVDARGRALYASAGHPGSCNDAGVWGRDALRSQCEEGILSTPQKELVIDVGGADRKLTVGPYFVGDGAFKTETYMMQCYPDDNTHAKRVYNQAVCDVRKVVEQAIGRLKMCWQFCHKNMFHGDTEFVRSCIEACVGLHNFRMDYNLDCDDEIVAEFVRKELGGGGGMVVNAVDAADAPGGVEMRDFLAAYLVHQED